ncbi:hypothetical protein [Halobacterium bonnevillei]|uniref:Envelope protein N-terminal domain-containing protein n=1 Tax=Halobacterium bonnevillei TaxID=2692200 RepID=A0A6B0ST63_9EURY|nr:hypothetical protein [Halobacterium bonnevillei]MXR20769.1 hypothetical protein [Halobacterium bonnevillei]
MSRGPTLRGVGVVLMAIGLVTALAGGGFLGPGAESTLDEASPIGAVDALGFTAGVVITGGLLAAGYLMDEYHSGADGDSTVAVDANETYQEVHAQSQLVAGQADQSTTILNNTVLDGAQTMSWTQGKASFMDALSANKSKAVARQWASENVTTYYSVTETNVVRQFNATTKELQYLAGVHEAHSDLGPAYQDTRVDNSIAESDFVSFNYTLSNGTNVSYVAVYNQFDGNDGGHVVALSDLSNQLSSADASSLYFDGIKLQSAYNQSAVPVLGTGGQDDYNRFHNLLNELQTQEGQMSTNIEAWSNQTYDSWEAGNVNITDVPDPITLAKQFATDYNSTGHYAYAGADLAMMGVKTEMNTSFTVEVPSENETLYGQMYTDWEPAATNGSLETGHLYNVSKTDEIVYMATNDGLRAIGSDFKITSMTNVKTGESTNSTTTESYNTQTADVTLTQEQLQQLLELRESVQEREEAAASGGGFFDGLGLSADVAVPGLVVAAGAALVLLGRT